MADDILPDCLVKEGIGPDNAMKFDVPADIVAMAKVRQPMDETLYTGAPEG